MIFNKNKKFVCIISAAVSLTLAAGFTSKAADLTSDNRTVKNASVVETGSKVPDKVMGVPDKAVGAAQLMAREAERAYLQAIEQERKAAEEAARIAREQEEAEAAALEADKELLASLIFCEAGNQPYEGQVAVGAVVMNRVKSGVYPSTIREVIYQSGQFTPAMTGWLDSILYGKGYTEAAYSAAEEALAGSNPVGECMYFSTGGYGMQIGDHYFH